MNINYRDIILRGSSMTIHVVQPGETLGSIADQYKISADRLILENGIENPDNLAVDQTIVIIQPLISHTVQEGDTIFEIADKYNVSPMQIYRNNPYLAEQEYIDPGESIVISYDSIKVSPLVTSGYAYSFISIEVLQKTLPFLTYLTVFNYRQTMEGDIIDVDDQEIIDMAKEYGVAPLMMVSTQTEQGVSSLETAITLLNRPDLQDRLIDNIVEVLKRKGYYGLNQFFQFYNVENQELYLSYVEKLSERLKREGFPLIITITPREHIDGVEGELQEADYSLITQYADALTLLTYNWGYSYGPPASATPVNLLSQVIQNVIKTVPADKVLLGLPVIGYDWPLPYVPGVTKANAITPMIAIIIAAINGVEIQYCEFSQAAYFFYNVNHQSLHNVWFKDARSISAISKLVPQNGLGGLSIWNIMYFNAQMLFVLNNLYDIQRVEYLGEIKD